jgi:hypothetical protein
MSAELVLGTGLEKKMLPDSLLSVFGKKRISVFYHKVSLMVG